jgi:general stress protein 26
MAERPLGVLATIGRDGLPHAVPVEVLVHDGKVYAWSEGDSAKVANVKRTGKAALVAYKGVAAALVRGPARLVRDDDPSYGTITKAFLAKYKREENYGNDTLIEITPERVAAWEE